MVNLNYNGPYAITQSLAKYMIKNSPKPQRNGAQIVVISSMAAKLCPGFRSSYCSTKAALSGLFDSIRVEVNIKIYNDSWEIKDLKWLKYILVILNLMDQKML